MRSILSLLMPASATATTSEPGFATRRNASLSRNRAVNCSVFENFCFEAILLPLSLKASLIFSTDEGFLIKRHTSHDVRKSFSCKSNGADVGLEAVSSMMLGYD